MQWAAAGTKAPLPHRVQAKEGSPLWVTSLVALQLLIKKKTHIVRAVSCFMLGKMRTATWEITSQIALRRASQVAVVVKNLSAIAGDIRDTVLTPDQEDPLEEGMGTHSSILAWRIPWTGL